MIDLVQIDCLTQSRVEDLTVNVLPGGVFIVSGTSILMSSEDYNDFQANFEGLTVKTFGLYDKEAQTGVSSIPSEWSEDDKEEVLASISELMSDMGDKDRIDTYVQGWDSQDWEDYRKDLFGEEE